MKDIKNIKNKRGKYMFTKLIDALRIARDDFKSKALIVFKEREERLDTINRDYRQGSPTQQLELNKMEEKYDKQMEKIRGEATEFVNSYFTDAREYETKRVKKFDVVTLNSIKAISDLPISYSELVILNDYYGKDRNYWVEKMLVEIAEKNGVPADKLGLEASLETKLDIISQLEQQFIELINNFDGKATYKNGAYLHDAILTKAEQQYRNGLKSDNSEQLAHQLFGLVTSKGTVNEQGVAINNIIRNADEMTKLEFMYLVSNSSISDEAVMCSGYYSLFEEFKSKTANEYEKAKEVMKSIKQAKTVKEVENMMQGMENNCFINEMLENEKSNYTTIREYLADE